MNMRMIGVWSSILLSSGVILGGAIAHADSELDAFLNPPGTIEFEGANLFSTAKGTFHRWRITERSIDPAALEQSFAVVEVDLASLDTGIERRDDHLRNPDFFEVETHPIARVRFHSATPDGATDAGAPRFKARFDIDLHGVQKTVEGVVTLENERPLTFVGSVLIDRTDFGVGAPPSRWNPMSVKADIPIRFTVQP